MIKMLRVEGNTSIQEMSDQIWRVGICVIHRKQHCNIVPYVNVSIYWPATI